MSIAKGCGNCIREVPSADRRSPMERKTVQMGLVCSLLFHFSLLHLFFVVHGENSTDTPITLISRDLYHSSDSIIKEIKALVDRHPDRLTMETMRNGASDYFADILVVTYNRGKDDFDGSEFRILLSFGQHGRELITSEVALRLLAVLSEEHKMQKTEFDYLKNLPKRLIVKMVPMENLNGRKLVEAGDLCDRRNGRGVDLNRNWSVDWGKKEEDYDPYEENPGTAPFSEPETQIIRSLAKSFNPHVWVNVHSGMEALFMPYDHKNSTPAGVALEVMKSMLEELNQFHCKERCLIGSGGGSVGYLAHGTATDYMYDVVKVPMAFTFEIYGDLTASSKDCFKMFNPIDSVTFERVLDVWCSSFLRIFVIGPSQLGRIRKSLSTSEDRWVSIDTYLDGKLMSRNKQISTSDVLDFGIQELRTYFRLFLLSSILLIFMFCSRISRNKYRYMMPNMMTL